MTTNTQYRCELRPMTLGAYVFQIVADKVHLSKDGVTKILSCSISAFSCLAIRSWIGEHNQRVLDEALTQYWDAGSIFN